MGLISRVSSRTYRKMTEVNELCQSLDKAIEAAEQLAVEKSVGEKYYGEPIYDCKIKTFAGYQRDLVKVVEAKSKGVSLTFIDDTIYDSCVKRTILERIRPLELKVQPRIDKLLKTMEEGGLDKSDPLNFKPNLADFSDSDSSDNDENDPDPENPTDPKSGIYKPPKLVSVPYPEENEPYNKAEQDAKEKKARQRALKSSQIKELADQLGDHPIEHFSDKTREKATHSRVLKDRDSRIRAEEESFKRFGLTKKQRKKEEKALTRDDMETIASFGDISMLEGAG